MKDITAVEIIELIGLPARDIVILDIGSYDGEEVAAVSELLGDRKHEIHCFEADARSVAFWINKNESNLKMTLWNVAIGNKDWEKIKLYKSDSETRRHEGNESWSASSSIRPPKTHLELFPDVQFNDADEVDVSTLDMWSWFHDFNIIDFIWCDVNGAEEDVILGAKDTLKTTRYLYIEFSDKELYEGQISKQQLLNLLPDFEEVAIYNFGGNFGNVLLKNKNLC